MGSIGLYLSGNGSLDGSDVFSTVLAYLVLQEAGLKPVPVGRDIPQGEVLNHRTARSVDQDRNSLDEAARMVRGKIKDMRDVDADTLNGAVFVGGGGTLSTWTDYHERGRNCRVTERLKYQVMDLYRDDKPLLCLDNAGFAVSFILREVAESLRINPGSNEHLNQVIEDWGVSLTEETPSWDEEHLVGSLPDLTREDDLRTVREGIAVLLERANLD